MCLLILHIIVSESIFVMRVGVHPICFISNWGFNTRILINSEARRDTVRATFRLHSQLTISFSAMITLHTCLRVAYLRLAEELYWTCVATLD
jgi:hypothetical protein